MITLIVPTRNRAHTLRRVLSSYFSQADVNELIFVSDAGTDESQELIESVARGFPQKRVKVLRNEERRGASLSRNIGVQHSENEYILFCDDDEYLESNYARTCLAKLKASGAGAVSGRRVYMRPDETPDEALLRFGHGLRDSAPFRVMLCEYVNGARFNDDIELPFTNAIIMTTRSLLREFPFDGFYARGNGYREETDFQMNLYVHGIRILVTNDCHSIHLPLSEVRTGGQRTAPLKRLYWSIYYTNYFYRKYYQRYAERIGLHAPRWLALACFAAFAVYRETLRPPLYRIWATFLAPRRQTGISKG